MKGGQQGSRNALETSTALTNRNGVGLAVTVTNQSGAVTFPAPGASSETQRFYRAVWESASGRHTGFLPNGRKVGLVGETVCVQPGPPTPLAAPSGNTFYRLRKLWQRRGGSAD